MESLPQPPASKKVKRKRKRTPEEQAIHDEKKRLIAEEGALLELQASRADELYQEEEQKVQVELNPTPPPTPPPKSKRRKRGESAAPPSDVDQWDGGVEVEGISPADMAAARASTVEEPGALPGEVPPPEEVPPPHFVPISSINWDDFVQSSKDPITDPDFCLWCRYAQCAQELGDKGNKGFERLVTYNRENWGRVHPFEFARESQKIYNEFLRKNLTDGKNRHVHGPAWPARNIYEHPVEHVLHAKCVHLENAYTIRKIMRAVADQILMSDKSTNAKNIKIYLEAEKQARTLFDKVDANKTVGLFGF